VHLAPSNISNKFQASRTWLKDVQTLLEKKEQKGFLLQTRNCPSERRFSFFNFLL